MILLVSGMSAIYSTIVYVVIFSTLVNSEIITRSNFSIGLFIVSALTLSAPIILVFWAYRCGELDEKLRTKRDFWTIKKNRK